MTGAVAVSAVAEVRRRSGVTGAAAGMEMVDVRPAGVVVVVKWTVALGTACAWS